MNNSQRFVVGAALLLAAFLACMVAEIMYGLISGAIKLW